jgi:LEA14-like dessication related protein
MSMIFARSRLGLGFVIVVICLVAATVVGLRGLISCQIESAVPRVQVTSIALREVSLTEVAVDVTVRVENPNSIGATIDRIAYDIHFRRNDDWVHLGEADRTEDVYIAGKEEASIDITHEVGTLSAVTMLSQVIRQAGKVDVRAQGTVWIKVGPVSMEVPFERIRTLGDPTC